MKITTDTLNEYFGSDYKIEDCLSIIVDIVNGNLTIEQFKTDIAMTCEIKS